jgi:hypothetical protein
MELISAFVIGEHFKYIVENFPSTFFVTNNLISLFIPHLSHLLLAQIYFSLSG